MRVIKGARRETEGTWVGTRGTFGEKEDHWGDKRALGRQIEHSVNRRNIEETGEERGDRRIMWQKGGMWLETKGTWGLRVEHRKDKRNKLGDRKNKLGNRRNIGETGRTCGRQGNKRAGQEEYVGERRNVVGDKRNMGGTGGPRRRQEEHGKKRETGELCGGEEEQVGRQEEHW